MCCRVCLAAVKGRDGEVEDVAVKLSVWMDGHRLHQKKKNKNKKKTGLFTVQQASELEDHTKPSAGQDSTWKKLQLLKVLLRCLCRLSEGRADWVDSSGDCSLWNRSFWFWTVIKNQTNKSGSDWKGYEWVQFLIKYFGIQFLSLLLCRSLPFSP